VAAADAARVEADGALKAWVRGEFGTESAEANDFGYPAPRKAVMTAEQKALAVEKGRATRKVRGTVGARQREKIHGALPRPAAHLDAHRVEPPGATPAALRVPGPSG
jgi:hypothetical protein